LTVSTTLPSYVLRLSYQTHLISKLQPHLSNKRSTSYFHLPIVTLHSLK
jgi:hypothetical protein